MKEQEKMDIIIQNLFDTISNISDTRDLLIQNEQTKKYLEDFEKFEEDYQESQGVEKANERYETTTQYEQAISITAFLIGFQKGIQVSKMLEDKNFVDNMLHFIY